MMPMGASSAASVGASSQIRGHARGKSRQRTVERAGSQLAHTNCRVRAESETEANHHSPILMWFVDVSDSAQGAISRTRNGVQLRVRAESETDPNQANNAPAPGTKLIRRRFGLGSGRHITSTNARHRSR